MKKALSKTHTRAKLPRPTYLRRKKTAKRIIHRRPQTQNHMDTNNSYCFEVWEGEQIGDDDHIPDDYEGETDDYQGRFRRCHDLIERRNPDSMNLVRTLMEKLFHRSSSYNPSRQEIPESFQVNCRCSIFNFVESLLRDERRFNQNKFVITAVCSAATRRIYTGSTNNKALYYVFQ